MQTGAIRKAAVDDAYGIASVHVRSWQVAYRGQIPDDFLDRLDVKKRANMWRELIQDPNKVIFVAENTEGNIIGFCALGPSRDSDTNPSAAEVSAIYIDPDKWQKGIGRALLSASLSEIRNRDFDQVTLWVLEANQRARSFYESFGFVQDGANKDDDRWKDFVLREFRYRLNLRGTEQSS
jgi:ribosomal protein S18 acetylase RimI-like enzyme